MSDTTRNVLIVVGAALLLTLFTGVLGPIAGLLLAVLQILLLVALAYLAYTFWRGNRYRIAMMPQTQQALLYGAAALLVLVIVSSRFWVASAFSALLFFALLAGCAFVLYRVWQDATRYY
jgi:hypothetical protein